MAKAKKKKTSRISPAVPKNRLPQPSLYDDLSNGDAFLLDEALYMKTEMDDQQAIDLDTGYIEDNLCGQVVVPVNISVKWLRK